MTDFPVSSDKLTKTNPNNSKYPWDEVPVGRSFSVDKSGVKLGVLRTLAWKAGIRHGKKFRVVEHNECYEVGRLPDPVSDSKEVLENKGFKV